MGDNKDKFKLIEDPEVSGGMGLTWKHCPICGEKLKDYCCPYCEIDYLETITLDDESNLPPDEIEVPMKRTNASGRKTTKNRRQRR